MDTGLYGMCQRQLPEIADALRELTKCQANIVQQFLVGKKLRFFVQCLVVFLFKVLT